ncbi:hypothetical protein SLE2022_395210 [Rubroshorea leprosula]
MSVQAFVTLTPTCPPNAAAKEGRPTANFHPSLWRDRFLEHSSDFMKSTGLTTKQEFEDLKQELSKMLKDGNSDHSKKLHLINAVQFLGVDYHFEEEIEDALQKIYDDGEVDYDLSTVALWFRLLRQQGIKAPSEVFKKFVDKKGKFKADLVNDVTGVLNLYEAAHFGIQGEDILDEALAFTTSSLESIATQKQISTQLIEQITHALNRPIQKSFPRTEAKRYISFYSQDDHFASRQGALLRFAEIDFNMVQALHQQELSRITEWWKKLDLTSKLPYARDRLIECYFWMMGIYYEPKYSAARIFLAKVLAITSIVDDTFDSYGTYEELKIFEKCIERWDIGVIDQLPNYMKLAYQALLDLYSAIEGEVAKEGRQYAAHYGKESMKQIAKSYLVEAKWREEGCVPSYEEYMQNGLISGGIPLVIANSFVGMGKIASKEAFDWIFENPKIVEACSFVGRVMNDIASHQFERQRDHHASAVECYMKQHCVSKEEAVESLKREIVDAWKVINKERMKPTIFPTPLITRIVNMTRTLDLIYKDDDAYTRSYLLKDQIASLFVDPILV